MWLTYELFCRLPVVDKTGRLIGVLTRRDVVVAALADKKKKHTDLGNGKLVE